MEKLQSMTFKKLGGAWQPVLETPNDLKLVIENLEEARWMATSAPCESFNCNPVLLKYLDTDANGVIRTDEIKNSWQWLSLVLADYDGLLKKSDTLKLTAINTSSPEGEAIKNAAERVLINLGSEAKDEITATQIKDRQKIVASCGFNGDGIIVPEMTGAESVSQLVQDIIDTIGAVADTGGDQGISVEQLDKFVAEAEAFLEWEKTGQAPRRGKTSELMFLGEETSAKFAIFEKVQAKLDEFFEMCRLVKLNEVYSSKFLPDPEAVKQLNLENPEKMREVMLVAPLANPVADEVLSLDSGINPAYENDLIPFKEVLMPALKIASENTLSSKQWSEIKNRFAPYSTWKQDKRGGLVEKLGTKTLKAYLAGDEIQKLRDLIAEDKKVAEEIAQVESVEKLIFHQVDFLNLVNNFISLDRLFDPISTSMIQVGKLVMDGRNFWLTVKVTDRKQHKLIAEKSSICVMYLEITRRNGDKDEKMEIAAGITSGDISQIYVGKKGVFFKSDGSKWNAKIVDIIQQPVSISEALRLPFKKLGDFISKQTEKFTGSSYKHIETSLNQNIDNAEKSLTAPKPQGKVSGAAVNGSILMLGGGVGLAAMGSAFAFIVKSLKNVSILNILMVVLGIVLLLSLPVIIAAVIKLRKRNVGMFLEACGWSINHRLRLTRKMGLLFTHAPGLPKGSRRQRWEKIGKLLKRIEIEKSPWRFRLLVVIPLIIILLLAVIFYSPAGKDSLFDKWMDKYFNTPAYEIKAQKTPKVPQNVGKVPVPQAEPKQK